MRYCMYCGMPMEDDDVFCTRCGKSTPRDMPGREDAPRADREEEPEIRMRGMGYVHAGPEEESVPSRTRTGGGGKRQDSSRYILIASAVILVVVFGILLSLLIGPGKKDQEESGQEVASYENGGGTGADTEKLNQGQARPAVGSDGSSVQSGGSGQEGQASQGNAVEGDAAGAGGGQESDPAADPQATVPSGEEEDETALVSGNGEPDAEALAQQTADEDEDLTGQAGSAVPEEEDGWMVDEDGNEVYYAPDDAESADSDQTEIGGGGEKTGQDSSYIIPGSDSRYLTRQELETYDDYSLQMAINELYARHGRKFDTESIRTYFESKSWYHGTIDPADFDGHEAQYFNQYELANRELMTQIREERGADLTW